MYGQTEVDNIASAAFGDRVDAVFDVIAHPRRRTLLEVLREHEGAASEADLAARVVARERDVPVGDVSEPDRHEAHVTLHHTHLPKLAAHEVVDYDSSTRTVETGPEFERFFDAVRAAEAQGR